MACFQAYPDYNRRTRDKSLDLCKQMHKNVMNVIGAIAFGNTITVNDGFKSYLTEMAVWYEGEIMRLQSLKYNEHGEPTT